MSNFVMLTTGGTMPESEAEQAAVREAWGAWYQQIGDAVVDPGNPMAPRKSIAADGTVTDGSVGPMANGYMILKADSLDAAIEMARTCPVLQGGSEISLYETFEMT